MLSVVLLQWAYMHKIHHSTMPTSSCNHKGQDAIQGTDTYLTAWLLADTMCVMAGSGSGTVTVTSHSNADGPPAPAGPLTTPGTPFQDTDTGAAVVPAPPGPQPAGRTAGGQADLGTMNGERKLKTAHLLAFQFCR